MSEESTVNQGEIVNDFSQEFVPQEIVETSEENIRNDGGQTMLDEPEAEPTVKPENKSQKQEPPKQQTKEPPKQEQAKPDPLKQRFLNENGEFDVQKYVDFFNSAKKPEIKPVEPRIKAQPQQQPTAQADTREPWQKALEESRQYRTSMQSSLFAFRDFYNKAKQAGYPEQAAMQWAEQQVETWLNDHIAERDYKSRFEKEQALQKEAEEKAQAAALKPKSEANLAVVASEFGGMENLNQLLMTKELGGDTLLWLFDQTNQKEFDSQASYKSAFEDWFVRFSQNPDNVRRVASYAMRAYRDMHIKDVITADRKTQAAAPAARQKAVSAQTRTVTTANAKRKPDALDEFLTPHEQREFVPQEA